MKQKFVTIKAKGKTGFTRLVGEIEYSQMIDKDDYEVVESTKRARNKNGTLKADDKSTPNVNEAWEGGKAPAKKKKPGRPKKKK